MKRKKLIDPSAFVLQSDLYIYEQFPYSTGWHHQIPSHIKEWFEILDTSAFGSMSRYLLKWQDAMRPFKELFQD